MNLSNSDLKFIIAVSAIVISITAILLAVMTLKMQREHNMLSIRPICFVDVFDYSNRTAVELYYGAIGPMIINDINLSRGVEYRENLLDWMPKIEAGLRWENHTSDMKLSVIPAGSTLTILAFGAEEENQDAILFRNQIRKIMSELTVEVTYSNIYDKKLPVASRKLEIFGRRTSWDNPDEQKEPVESEVIEEKEVVETIAGDENIEKEGE